MKKSSKKFLLKLKNLFFTSIIYRNEKFFHHRQTKRGTNELYNATTQHRLLVVELKQAKMLKFFYAQFYSLFYYVRIHVHVIIISSMDEERRRWRKKRIEKKQKQEEIKSLGHYCWKAHCSLTHFTYSFAMMIERM